MSEYQYYEFQAIDRKLTGSEMTELREYSSRANVTPTSFINEYSYGNFRGNVDAWMDKYFDAFLYVANWGTYTLKFRVPESVLPLQTARLYCVAEQASAREKDGAVILTFESVEEGGGGWVDGEGRLASIIPVRTGLIDGDMRALYLGWLLCAQYELNDDAIEPEVPAGLGQLPDSLESFSEFLGIDPDLIAAAAASSPALMDVEPSPDDVRAWIGRLSVAEKDAALEQIISGDSAIVRTLRKQMKGELAGAPTVAPRPPKRSVADLLQSAKDAAEIRKRVAAERAAQEKAQAEREAAAARARHIASLQGKESSLWTEIDTLLAGKQARNYSRIVEVLLDLSHLATPAETATFQRRIAALKEQNRTKTALLARMRKAGL